MYLVAQSYSFRVHQESIQKSVVETMSPRYNERPVRARPLKGRRLETAKSNTGDQTNRDRHTGEEMDLNLTPKEEQFRDEFRAWLQANIPDEWDPNQRDEDSQERFEF